MEQPKFRLQTIRLSKADLLWIILYAFKPIFALGIQIAPPIFSNTNEKLTTNLVTIVP